MYVIDVTDDRIISLTQLMHHPSEQYNTIPYHTTPYAKLKKKIEMRNRVELNFTNTKQKEGRRKGKEVKRGRLRGKDAH